MIGVIHLLLQKGYSDILVLFDCLELNDMRTFEILLDKVKLKKLKSMKLSAIKAMNKYFEQGKSYRPPMYYAIINENTELLNFIFNNFSKKDIFSMLECQIDGVTVFSAIFSQLLKTDLVQKNHIEKRGNFS